MTQAQRRQRIQNARRSPVPVLEGKTHDRSPAAREAPESPSAPDAETRTPTRNLLSDTSIRDPEDQEPEPAATSAQESVSLPSPDLRQGVTNGEVDE